MGYCKLLGRVGGGSVRELCQYVNEEWAVRFCGLSEENTSNW